MPYQICNSKDTRVEHMIFEENIDKLQRNYLFFSQEKHRKNLCISNVALSLCAL